MKTTVLMLALLISIGGVAQVLHTKDQKFVRIFNLDEIKVLKGHLYSVTDSTLTLAYKNKLKTIDVTDLGSIKFKRSKGGDVFKGAALFGALGAILGAATAEPSEFCGFCTVGEGLAMGFVIGAFGGGAIGGVAGALRKEQMVEIHGNFYTWVAFKNSLLSGGE